MFFIMFFIFCFYLHNLQWCENKDLMRCFNLFYEKETTCILMCDFFYWVLFWVFPNRKKYKFINFFFLFNNLFY